MLRGVVAEAHSILVVSNIRRACNDKGAKDMLPLLLRRALLERGVTGDLAAEAIARSLLLGVLCLDAPQPLPLFAPLRWRPSRDQPAGFQRQHLAAQPRDHVRRRPRH